MNRVSKISTHLTSGMIASNNKNEYGLVGEGGGNEVNYVMNEDNILTKEQVESYNRDGYLVIRNCLSEEVIDGFIGRFRHLIAHPEERPPMMSVVRDVGLVKKGLKKQDANTEQLITKFQDFVEDDEAPYGLFQYCRRPEITKIAQAIVGKGTGLQGMHTMLINKPTDLGKGTSSHPLHQDQWYFTFGPPNKIVAAWCAMEKITKENGCLTVVPGTHKTELLKHGYPDFDVNKAYHQILGIDISKVNLVDVPMNKGDVVFFHPYLWHGSGPNNSPNTRKAISCHFCRTDAKYHPVVGTIQEEIENEVLGIYEKILTDKGMKKEDIPKVDFSDLWNIRSKVVVGDTPIQKAE